MKTTDLFDEGQAEGRQWAHWGWLQQFGARTIRDGCEAGEIGFTQLRATALIVFVL